MPAFWVKFLPPAQAKEIIEATTVYHFCRLSQKLPFQPFGGILAGAAAILAFLALFDTHTPWGTWADM